MAVNVQVYDFYQWSIWWKRYQLELTIWPLLQRLARIRLFFTCDPRNREVFELQTVLQSVRELHVPSKRVPQVKNSSGPVALILCGPCKEHTEKEVSRKNNEGKGYGVRAVGTPVIVLFNKISFQILPVNQILVNSLNGLFWQLLSTVYYLKEMRGDSDDIIG